MPNLENLRKQAKLFLRWHREGYFPVAARISGLLERYKDLSDRDVLLADFKLADAQRLVARRHGFESWPALVKGLQSMTDSASVPPRPSTILAAEPQIFVSDMERAFQFYVGKLGFGVGFRYGKPPFYAQLCRDNARVNLRRVQGPVFSGDFRRKERDALSATFILDDPKPLFLEFQNAKVAFHQTLKDEPWGARTFIVQDPDGNLVCFAGGTNDGALDSRPS